MALDFNSQGNLHQTICLTYEEIVRHFANSEHRMQLLHNALPFIQRFHTCGCTTAYIGGSYVSTKKRPEDIDICFDLTGIDEGKLKKEFPEFFDLNKRGSIRRDLKCHILHFDHEDAELLDLLKEDRDGRPKGLIKLDLNDLINYAKK